ncbi:MAG: SMC family ATPase [Candidatus Woesearchaeota archaeon]
MIKKLILENWKKHEFLELDFSKGVNVIVGEMGTGKSSILQAINYCLFGNFNELKSREIKTDDLIMNGKDECNIKLYFDEYIIERSIKKGKTTEANIRNNKENLAGPSTVEVNNYIEEKLKINEDVFLKAIYSSQNDIDTILKVTPTNRKKIIDELMNLTEFEIVRKNAVSLINKLNNQKEIYKKFLDEFNQKDLFNHKEITLKKIEELNTNKVEFEKNIPELKNNYIIIKDKLNLIQDKKYKNKSLTESLNKLKSKIMTINIDKETPEIDFEFEIKKLDNNIINLKQDSKEIHSLLEKLSNEKITYEKNLLNMNNLIDNYKKEMNYFEKNYSEYSDINFYEINNNYQKLYSELIEIKRNFESSKIKLVSLRDSLDRLNNMDSKCFVCDNIIDEENKKSLISRRKSEIAITLMKQNELTEKIENSEGKTSNLKKYIDIEEQYKNNLDNYNSVKINLSKIENEISNIKNNIFEIDKNIVDNKKNVVDVEKLLEHNELHLKKLYQKKENINKKIEFNNINQEIKLLEKELLKLDYNPNLLDILSSEFETISNDMAKSEYKLKQFDNDIKIHVERLKTIEEKFNSYEDLNLKLKNIMNKINFLIILKNKLFESQELLRDDLILAVNEELSNIWIDLYPYDNFTNLRIMPINNDYFVQLKEYKGEWKNIVGYASGGEKMLSCISTKIAFSKILSPSVGLIILDEPTHNLDNNAVNNFISIINNNIKSQINQLIIVTHDNRLAESGEKVIKLINN